MNLSDTLTAFEAHLITEEKSTATREKYLRDVRAFLVFGADRPLTKELVLQYKEQLVEQYAPASVNSMLASLNCFLSFPHPPDLLPAILSHGEIMIGGQTLIAL